MMNVDLVVFDWDGTVVDSTPSITLAIQQACSDIGVAIPAAEDARWVIGLGLQDALSRVAPNLTVDQQHQLTERFRHHYLSRYEQLQMFPGMWELLHGLQSSGMPLAVATGKTRVGLDRSFELTQTRHLFATSRCADESEPKPAPKMVLEICAELGISPSSTLVIGDTTHDIFMARAAGASALAVGYGAHAAEELLAAEPLGCMLSVNELENWITQWISK
jgi:phosphoglycolate phosphatase